MKKVRLIVMLPLPYGKRFAKLSFWKKPYLNIDRRKIVTTDFSAGCFGCVNFDSEIAPNTLVDRFCKGKLETRDS